MDTENLKQAFRNFDGSVENMRRNESLHAEELRGIVDSFETQVTRLRDIFGMMAENMQRQACGQSMAYYEADFAII